MELPANMRRRALYPDSGLPRYATQASESVMRLQVSSFMHHPCAVDTGHSMPLWAKPGSGKTFFMACIISNLYEKV